MIITPVKTHPIVKGETIDHVLDKYIVKLKENSIIVVTSKIVSICEGRMVKIEDADKDELIKQESQYYLPRNINKYNISYTITQNFLVAGAGIDESNGNGYYILWPEDPQESVNKIREYLAKKFKLEHVGVIISDSKANPLRWGVTGAAIAQSGFMVLKDYIGTPDIFGRPFTFEKLNISDSLAGASVSVMGEGNEQIPLAIITDIPFVEFVDRNPTQEEIDELKIEPQDDIYHPLLTSVKWKKGNK